jgi:O-acetyl-ADP-ribose deacetylase (regulator of RNase III)
LDIKIYLRDKNVNIVNAWKIAFSDYSNVVISCGNILDLKADAIISPANSFGFMDGGIDLVYSEYFGWDLQKKLQENIREKYSGEIPVGAATIVKTYNTEIKYLISAPTMRIPGDVSNTLNAYLAFRASLIEILKFNENNEENIFSVLCPGLGTLTGNISPEKCAFQMKFAYDSIIMEKYPFPNSLNDLIRLEHMRNRKR